MKRNKIDVIIMKEKRGYSAYASINDDFIGTQGDSFDELKSNILDAINLLMQDSGTNFTLKDLNYLLDLPSFFNFYKVINAKALSERIGMNQSLLAQYISGKKKPSPSQKKKIYLGVKTLGKELSEIRFML